MASTIEKEVPWFFRPWFYTKKENEKATAENIRNQHLSINPKPTWPKTSSPASSLGLAGILIGIISFFASAKNDNNFGKTIGGLLTLGGIVLPIVKKIFYGVDLSKQEETAKPDETGKPEQSGGKDNTTKAPPETTENKIKRLKNEFLTASDFEAKKFAAYELAKLQDQDPALIDFFTEQAKSTNTDLRQAAVFGIGGFKDKKRNLVLIEMLKNPNELSTIRLDAAMFLGIDGNTEAVEPLISALDDPDTVIKSEAAKSLGNIGDTRAIRPLLCHLHNGDMVFDRAISASLYKFSSGSVAEYLKDSDDSVAKEAVNNLIETLSYVDFETSGLKGFLADSGNNENVRLFIIQKLEEALIPPFDDKFLYENASSYVLCLEQISKNDTNENVRNKSNETLKSIIEAMKNADPTVSDYLRSGQLLTKLAGFDPTIKDFFISCLDKEGNTKKAGICEICSLNLREAAPKLIDCLSDKDTEIVSLAAFALGRLQEKSSVDKLINLLSSDNLKIALTSAEALGKIKDTRAVRPLIGTLVKEVARPRPLFVFPKPVLPDYDPRDHLLENLREALQSFGKEGVPALIHCFGDSEETVSNYASSELWTVCKREGIAPVVEFIKSNEASSLKVKAISFLTGFKNKDVISFLTDDLLWNEDPLIRASSATALSMLEATSAENNLKGLLKDQDSIVRTAAAWSLGRLGSRDSVPELHANLQAQNKDELKATLWALGRIGEADSFTPLSSVYEDSQDDEIRKYSLGAMKGIVETNWDYFQGLENQRRTAFAQLEEDERRKQEEQDFMFNMKIFRFVLGEIEREHAAAEHAAQQQALLDAQAHHDHGTGYDLNGNYLGTGIDTHIDFDQETPYGHHDPYDPSNPFGTHHDDLYKPFDTHDDDYLTPPPPPDHDDGYSGGDDGFLGF